MPIIDRPRSYIKKENIKKWKDEFDILLNEKKNELVSKYFSECLHDFVKRLDNPYEIPWIRSLNYGEITWLNNYLVDLKQRTQIPEKELKNNIKDLLLERGNKDPLQSMKDINSLHGELLVYEQLKEKGCRPEKISEIGDWSCNGKLIQVKSKESMTAKYSYVGNTLGGLAYLEENNILWQYPSIRLKGLDKLNDSDLNMLLFYLRKYLINDLQNMDIKLSKSNLYIERESKEMTICNKKLKIYLNGTKKTGKEYYRCIKLYAFLENKKRAFLKFAKNNIYKSIHVDTEHTSSRTSSKWKQEDIQNLKNYLIKTTQKVFKKNSIPDVLWFNIFLDFDIYNTSNRKEVYKEFRLFIEQKNNKNIKIFFTPILKFDYDKDKPTLIENQYIESNL